MPDRSRRFDPGGHSFAEIVPARHKCAADVILAKSSRLRFFLTAMHTEEEIETAIDATVSELEKIPESTATLKIPSYQV